MKNMTYCKGDLVYIQKVKVMKKVMTEVFVYLRKYNGSMFDNADINLSIQEQKSCDTFTYALVEKIEVPLTELSDDDKGKILSGAELESLQAMKERLQAETHRKLAQIDERIQELQAIEFKD